MKDVTHGLTPQVQCFDKCKRQGELCQKLSRSKVDLLKHLESGSIFKSHRLTGCIAIVCADLLTTLCLDSHKISLCSLSIPTTKKLHSPLTVDNSLGIACLRLTCDFIGDRTILIETEFYVDLEGLLYI